MWLTETVRFVALNNNKLNLIEMNDKKPRCYNCKHKSQSFKVGKLTHLHCMNEEIYTKEQFENGETSAWDTLRVFSDVCDKHEFKP